MLDRRCATYGVTTLGACLPGSGGISAPMIRPTGGGRSMTPAGRAIVILAVTTVVAVAEAGVSNSLTPSVPDTVTTLVGSVVLEGDIAADASDGVDPETLPRSPSGTECLETIERPAGPMALCWDAYRDPHDADPLQDFYRLRVHGTFGRERGAGVRWAAIRVRLIGSRRTRPSRVGPTESSMGGAKK